MRNQRERLKLGIKYCGGCGPKFDRVALVERVRIAVYELWDFVSWEDDNAGHILIVAGCETACVDPEPFKNKTVHWVNSEANEQEIVEHLRLVSADLH